MAGNPSSLWRRYSEFEMLRNYLVVTFPYVIVPPLPEKRVNLIVVFFAFFGVIVKHENCAVLPFRTL